MTQTGTSMLTSQRIERLLRSLVGVSDTRLHWNAGALRAVHILRDARVQPHQLIRNIVSGLHAGAGVAVLPTQVHVHDDASAFEAIVVAPRNEAPTDAAPNGNGTAKLADGKSKRDVTTAVAVHRGNGHAVPTPRDPVERPLVVRPVRPAPAAFVERPAAVRAELERLEGLQLERIDVERRGSMLRCRTVLSLQGRMYSAIAEVLDAPAAEAELAARVAVDALRAGDLTEATLDGVGFVTVADVNYCIATVREPGRAAPRAGAAPMIDSMAAAATSAALTALGKTIEARAKSRALT